MRTARRRIDATAIVAHGAHAHEQQLVDVHLRASARFDVVYVSLVRPVRHAVAEVEIDIEVGLGAREYGRHVGSCLAHLAHHLLHLLERILAHQREGEHDDVGRPHILHTHAHGAPR